MDKRPIGIFDSGIGGTSVWRELQKLLPQEHTIYLADSKNAPYGERSKQQIEQLSVKNVAFLLERDCKLIVVACNTATTNAIDHLRQHYNIPLIGTEPAIKPAALKSRSKTVGVLATKGTLASALFHSTSKNHAAGIRVIEQVGTGLVPLIEAGKVYAPETRFLLQKYLAPMLEAGIDYLVLGCTHYPYLNPVLEELLPPHVEILDSGEAIARQTRSILERNGQLNLSSEPVTHQFYTNADLEVLKAFLEDVEVPYRAIFLDF